jgi:hypothetical protein
MRAEKMGRRWKVAWIALAFAGATIPLLSPAPASAQSGKSDDDRPIAQDPTRFMQFDEALSRAGPRAEPIDEKPAADEASRDGTAESGVPSFPDSAEAALVPAEAEAGAAGAAAVAEAEARDAEAAAGRLALAETVHDALDMAAEAEAEAADAEAEAEAEASARAEMIRTAALSDVVASALVPNTQDAARVSTWVSRSGDNGGLPYIVIDKINATLFVFNADGEFLGEAPVLIGIATGDEATPGVGDVPLAEMGPEEKTTPAGRFAARYGPAIGGPAVLWVDYNTSVALHPVVTGNRRERRLQRLRSATPDDNRITFGCINVPIAFHREVIRPLFRENGGIVYVLPDTRLLEDVFPSLRVQSTGLR